MVLRALLRHSARGAQSADRRAPHVAGGGVVPVPALAGSLPSALDALQGMDRAVGARDLRFVVHRAGIPRIAARRDRRGTAGPGIHGVLLRILLAHARLLAARPGETGS